MKTTLIISWLAVWLAFGESAMASPGAHGPNGEHLDVAGATSAGGLARLPDGSVNVPKLAQRRMAIRTIKVELGDHAVAIELNGRTAMDPNAGGRVQAPFAGRIEAGPQGLPIPGQAVRKGQVLAILRPVASAAERGGQQAMLADVRANRTLLEKRVQRLEALEGTVAQKEVDAARAELASLVGREKAISSAVNGAESVIAPADGVVASAQVLAGQIVESRDVLFEVVHPDRMLIEASSPDPSLAGRIQSASLAQAPAVQLTVVGAARSLRDGALPVLFQAKGQSLPLAIGQPVTVLARVKATEKGIAVPAAALVRNPANETVVWIKSGAMRFIAQPVEAKPIDAHTVVVTKGLSAENRVVVSGAALINQIR